MCYKHELARYKGIVEEKLFAIVDGCGAPKELKSAMRYSLEAGGKRLRPAMTLYVCEMLDGDIRRALPFACALEMIHTYSLIHDDLPCMDNDDYRRGMPSNHKVFGEANAVLAGDGLLSLAFDTMLAAIANNPCQGEIKAAQAVSEGAGVQGMVAGQVADLASEKSGARDMDTLRFIHVNKTGAMIRASLLAGGCVAGADEEQLKALSDFGYAYGDLFQMTDDILDVEGSFESMGKTLGKDAQEGKLTYISLVGLEEAKKIAGQTAENALAALEIFGEKAWLLRELTNATLSRKS
ncbi:MAG: polyprenyl synthetase family protein [Christensenellaceae bacterium]|jgi:geranyltranstransferase|nr:polyprenyl synthetase family protein [Christensenellaceae bacterium]